MNRYKNHIHIRFVDSDLIFFCYYYHTNNIYLICNFRDGRIRVGDELINVCGKRLRGLTIEEAIKALKQPKRELDIGKEHASKMYEQYWC